MSAIAAVAKVVAMLAMNELRRSKAMAGISKMDKVLKDAAKKNEMIHAGLRPEPISNVSLALCKELLIRGVSCSLLWK